MERRIVLHIDMDCFFAQVEARENPHFKSKPTVVGADPKGGTGRGVVATCNYEARKFGIRSAMPISEAWRRCPEAVFLPVNGRLYGDTSRRIMEALRRHADLFEQVSIDEAYLDMTRRADGDWNTAVELAEVIKREILEAERLTCSIGLGPNKLVSKIAANAKKPDGLTLVRPEDALTFLADMDVGVLWGVGPKTKAMLVRAGIEKVRDVRERSPTALERLVGSFASELLAMARGEDTRPVGASGEMRSIGRQETFEWDTRDANVIIPVFLRLLAEVHTELCSERLRCRTVTATVRFTPFKTRTFSHTFGETNELKKLQGVGLKLLVGALSSSRSVRLVGVRVSNLVG